MAFNYDKLGPLGEWLQQLHRRPLGTIDVEKNYAAKQYDKDGNMNLALKGGKKDGWMLLKINKKKDRKKPNEREIKDKIKKYVNALCCELSGDPPDNNSTSCSFSDGNK